MNPERTTTLQTKLECALFSRQIAQYSDGELNVNLSWRIKQHIAVCTSCAEEVRRLTALSTLLSSAARRGPSGSFDALLAARVEKIDRKSGSLAKLRGSAAALIPGSSFLNSARRALIAPMAATMACLMFVGFALTRTETTIPVVKHAVSATSMPSDPSLVQTCVNQHRAADADDPLADTSAMVLGSRVDTLPVAPGQTQSLTDDDAAVLLDDGS